MAVPVLVAAVTYAATSALSSKGGGPSAPPPPGAPPSINDAGVKQAAADKAVLLNARRGRASTILTSPSGVGGAASGGSTLLG